ncbi:MAG TPA: hypothetical protein ENN46_04505, partial [Candidatus Woesearchaeota archaeon]|nr:hypothetical protein [Candidatus Woesearchaeota archaeon]
MDPIQSLTWKIAMINLDQYHTISNILVFALIATLGFTIYRAIKQKLKKKLTKKRIKNLTVFILEVFIVGLAVFAYFHVIMHGKVFFPYEETDVKYFNGFHYIIEEADYNSHSTTVGIGYYAVPIALMRLFSINNILSLYNFVNLFLLCQLLIIAYLIYFFFKDKSSRLKAAVAVAAILMYPSTLVIVRYLRSIYTIVFISTLSSYILMKACSKKNSRIEFHILFSLNYALGCLTRPEFVILNFPILLNYIINQYK